MEVPNGSKEEDEVPLQILHVLQWLGKGRIPARVKIALHVLSLGAAFTLQLMMFACTLNIENASMLLVTAEALSCSIYILVRFNDYVRVVSRLRQLVLSTCHFSHMTRLTVWESERGSRRFTAVWSLIIALMVVLYMVETFIKDAHSANDQLSSNATTIKNPPSLLGDCGTCACLDRVVSRAPTKLLLSAGFFTTGLYFSLYVSLFLALSLHLVCQFGVLGVLLKAAGHASSRECDTSAGCAERQETEELCQLVQLIKRHQQLLSVFKDIRELISPAVLLMVVINLFKMTIVTVDMVLTPVSDAKFWPTLQLQVCVMISVFIYCWCGTSIAWQSCLVKEAAYKCNWIHASGRFKMMLQIMMTRAAIPATYSIGDYGPITLQTFLGMVNFSYSIYALVRQMYA